MSEYERVLGYLFSLYRFGSKLGLGPIRRVLRELGNPERGMKVIHVAGTNGKGSVCAMLASILQEAGYKVGLYTSPHLVDFRERIQVNGKMIPKKDVVRLFKMVKSKNIDLTYFEFVTALAFKYFREQEVDLLVLEVGLGGRLDATNVVRPLVSVITNVSKEHTDVLGNEIKQIAFEKAGIIKRGSIVITGAKGEALEVIERVCRERGSELIRVKNKVRKVYSDLDKQVIVYRGMKVNLPLLGDFQIENVNTALEVIEQLGRLGMDIPLEKIKKGLEKTRWPGRMEVVERNPLFILDGAHNPAGVRALRSFVSKLDYRRLILVLGVLKDKDYRRMIGYLKPLAFRMIITKPRIYRALEPEVIAKVVRDNFVVKENVNEALKEARSIAGKDDLILVTGSIYLVGNVKEIL